MNLKSRIVTILAVLSAPFVLVYLLVYMLITKWPDMDCVARPECDNDCSQCSMYEPKAAYQRRS